MKYQFSCGHAAKFTGKDMAKPCPSCRRETRQEAHDMAVTKVLARKKADLEAVTEPIITLV